MMELGSPVKLCNLFYVLFIHCVLLFLVLVCINYHTIDAKCT